MKNTRQDFIRVQSGAFWLLAGPFAKTKNCKTKRTPAVSLDNLSRQKIVSKRVRTAKNRCAVLPPALSIPTGPRRKTYLLQNKPEAVSCRTDAVRKQLLFAKQMAILARRWRLIASCGIIPDPGVFPVGTLAGLKPEVLVVSQFDFPGVI